METLKGVFSVLVMGALTAFMVWFQGPGVLRDWDLRNHYQPVMAEITGDCRAYVGVVNFCDIALNNGGGEVKDALLFVDFNMDGYDVMAVADTTDPTKLSTSLGVEKYWNRVATLAVMTLLLAGLTVGGVIGLFKPKPPEGQAAA